MASEEARSGYEIAYPPERYELRLMQLVQVEHDLFPERFVAVGYFREREANQDADVGLSLGRSVELLETLAAAFDRHWKESIERLTKLGHPIPNDRSPQSSHR